MLEDIITLVKAGKLVEAQNKLFTEMDSRRDELMEIGRQNLAESILPQE